MIRGGDRGYLGLQEKKKCALLYFCRDYSNIYFQKDGLCSRIIKGPPMYKDSLIPFSTKF